MSVVKVDETGHIREFCLEETLSGEDPEQIEINNGQELIDKCEEYSADVTDFIVENGKAIFSPLNLQEFNTRPYKSRIEELQENLNESDYYFAKIGEDLCNCETSNDILEVLKNALTKNEELLENRKAWRNEIRELTKKGENNGQS